MSDRFEWSGPRPHDLSCRETFFICAALIAVLIASLIGFYIGWPAR